MRESLVCASELSANGPRTPRHDAIASGAEVNTEVRCPPTAALNKYNDVITELN